MCDGKQALGRLVDIHSQMRIDAVVGLPCSTGLSPAHSLTYLHVLTYLRVAR